MVLSALLREDHRTVEAPRGTVSYRPHLLPGEVVPDGDAVPTVDTKAHLICLFLPLKAKEQPKQIQEKQRGTKAVKSSTFSFR